MLCPRPPMRTRYSPSHVRRILCVYPRYARSFGTFQHAYPFFGGRVARVHAAPGAPRGRRVPARVVGGALRGRELACRPPPTTSGGRTRCSCPGCTSSARRSRTSPGARTRTTGSVVVGGPSVSGCPEYYPDADILHLGELGDATDRLIEYLDRDPARPPQQLRFETEERLPLADFPTPAYDLIRAARVLHRQHPVLERLPVLVRVLRHPRALRAQPAPEDARPGPRASST